MNSVVDSLNGISGMSSPGNSDDEYGEGATCTVDFSKVEFNETDADSKVAPPHASLISDEDQHAVGAMELINSQREEVVGGVVIKTEEQGEWNREMDGGDGTQGGVDVKEEPKSVGEEGTS